MKYVEEKRKKQNRYAGESVRNAAVKRLSNNTDEGNGGNPKIKK